MLHPLTTQLVGSYTKPTWLIKHNEIYRLGGRAWLIAPDLLEKAQADVARLSIYDQERAGMDLLTDGEPWRSAWDRHFISRLGGLDMTRPANIVVPPSEIGTVKFKKKGEWSREDDDGLPRVVGPIEWLGPITVKELEFAKRQTNRPLKTQIVGPFTVVDRLADEYYHDDLELAMAVAAALNEELLALERAGAAALHIDDPVMHSRFSRSKRLGITPIERMIKGLTKPTTVHVCYGYAYSKESKAPSPTYPELLELLASSRSLTAISVEYEQPRHQPELLRHCGDKHVVLGLLDLGTTNIETPEYIASRLRKALEVIPAERLHPSSDCGMWHLPREVAFGKIQSLVKGTDIVRRELGLPTTGPATCS
ncbi:hypothetical protein [Bradyrhizobium sp. CCBAU 21362]|uniref:hypothetical protein n=1 Tax=Bradyrhizobium sp. CCBAU 21362 TaxID=1325082 RepID=UPI002305AEEA|nr:hypothetical protein [Bradyrhizobium sp. CCBAU 21362]